MKKKHGQEAYTIFRLLLKQGGPVETDEVSNFLCWGHCTLLYVFRHTLYAMHQRCIDLHYAGVFIFFYYSLCCKLQCMMLDFHWNLQITDKTILDKQIVHETLYKLWKDEYIDSEVCSINSTHVAFLASTNFFVYSHLFNNTFVPLLWSCCFKIVFSWKK